MLGVTMFLAMNYGAAAISANGSAFYNDANFRDIEIVSTRLLSPEDMDVLGAIEGVQDVEGVIMTQGKVASGLIRKDVNVTTCSDRINRPVLLEGKLPASAEACAVERDLAEEMGWQLGDRIEITDAGGQQARFLTGKEYVIEGIVIHPDHVCGSVPDTPYILVSPEAFDLDIFAGCFMKAELILDVPKDKGRFDNPYTAAVKQIRTQIDAVGQERAPIRQAEVDAQLTQVAEERLISGWDVLEEAKEEIRRAIRNKLAEVLGEEAVNSIEWITKWTVNPRDEYADAMSFHITEGVKIDLNLSLRENVEKLVSSLALQDEILKSAFMLLNGEGEYSREAATALLVDKVMPGLDKYEDKYAELTQGCSAWNDTHTKFLDGTLWEEIGLPGICRWIVTDVSGNMSYVQLNSSRESLTRLQMTFSLLFIAVSALVIYATVSKMIDEQRNLVGATKALGFYRREIFAKYLTFGVSGTLLGTLMGGLIARFGVEPFILNGYQIYYSIDITRGTLTVGPTLIVFVAGLLLSVSAGWFACRRLLKTP
ncbi:MAG: ABC transporter permease, partial [Clostridia bacterium]|nr:ABC transporter permease [Clostridia bacterium]